ncbi:IgGFc-binding protein [Biomphalaria glabrata]|nr:IgGFc-binding protein-like; partial [Biomphalaria glabrata]
MDLTFLLVCVSVAVKDAIPKTTSVSTVGTKFILYFTESSQHQVFPARPVHLYISTSSRLGVSVQITAPAWTEAPKINETATVTLLTPKIVTLPAELRTTELGSENKGVLVEASAPISVFAMNPSKNQAALCSVLSEASLGMEYIFPSFTFNLPSQGYIGIVAYQDQTWVEVTLPPSTYDPIATFKGQTYSPQMVIRVTLNKFQVAEIRQNPNCEKCDLTGAKIKTNKSAAVFSIISLSNPITDRDGGDLLVEQIIPVAFWGRTFVVYTSNAGDLIRIMAGEPNITVYSSDMKTSKLERTGDYIDKYLEDGQFRMYQASGRLQVMQYTPRPPFMLLVTPLEHYGSSAQVPTVMIETGSFQENSIRLLTETCNTNSITINSTGVSRKSWEKLGTTGFNYVSINVPPNNSGFHTIKTANDAVTFGGYVYGKGDLTAYAAPLVIDGVRPIETFYWATPDAIAMHEANLAFKDRIIQQSWKLKEKDVLSTQKPINHLNVFSISVCFSLCSKDRNCVYASIEKQATRNIVCRLFDDSMPCVPKTSAPGVRTYVSRIPFWEQIQSSGIFNGLNKAIDQTL